MHLSKEDLRNIIQQTQKKAAVSFSIIAQGQQGADHPIHPAITETEYLKMVMVMKRNT